MLEYINYRFLKPKYHSENRWIRTLKNGCLWNLKKIMDNVSSKRKGKVHAIIIFRLLRDIV